MSFSIKPSNLKHGCKHTDPSSEALASTLSPKGEKAKSVTAALCAMICGAPDRPFPTYVTPTKKQKEITIYRLPIDVKPLPMMRIPDRLE